MGQYTFQVYQVEVPIWRNMHEGCVPSPNQVVRGLDQSVSIVASGVGERGDIPFFVSRGW